METRKQENLHPGILPSSMRILFMGTPDFAVPSLQSLIACGFHVVGVVTQPDKPQGRHMIPVPPPVKTAAILHNIPVYQPEKVRDSDFIRQIAALSLDLIVTAAYGKILPVEILALPRFGCVNVHASMLPRYRGAAPVHWSVICGEEQTGVTIMKMDKGMDTGGILTQKDMDIPHDMTTGELMEELALAGSSILCDTILDYCSGRIKPVPQEESLATTVRPIAKEDGLIDWNHSARSVYNLIRGCDPWPIAYTFYRGKRLKLYKAAIPEEFPTCLQQWHKDATPGSIIVSENKTNLYFNCSDGCLEIMELQLEGGRRMPAGACAHNFISSDPQTGRKEE